MTRGFNKREPTGKTRIHLHPSVVDIFRRNQCLGFFKLLRGYDDDVAREFAISLTPQARFSATIVVRGLLLTITPESISRITTLPLGLQWRKEDKASITYNKKKHFFEDEEPIEDTNGIRRERIPYPWDEVSYHILKYICCEGKLSIVYGYQFRFLHEQRFGEELPPHRRLSVPYLFCNQ